MYDFTYLAKLDITHPDESLDALNGLFPWQLEHCTQGDQRYDKHGNSLGRKAPLSLISWRLHKESIVKSDERPLEELLLGCLESIKSREEKIVAITANRGTVQIEIAIRPAQGYCVLVLPADITAQLGRLGIQIAVCVVVPPGKLVVD
jgi:hypothetical protein